LPMLNILFSVKSRASHRLKWPLGRTITVVLAPLFASFLTLTVAQAATETIDLRVRSEPRPYGITLSAQTLRLGHAFVTLTRENEGRAASVSNIIGFYPAENKSDLEVLVGLSKGQLENDAREKADYSLFVAVNSDQFAKAEAIFSAWQRGGRYVLLTQDCTTFVGEIARAIGLKTPVRVVAPYPIDYIQEIVRLYKEQQALKRAQQEAQRNRAVQNAKQQQAEQDAAAQAFDNESNRQRAERDARARRPTVDMPPPRQRPGTSIQRSPTEVSPFPSDDGVTAGQNAWGTRMRERQEQLDQAYRERDERQNRRPPSAGGSGPSSPQSPSPGPLR
jgi:hypothetical protein